MKWAFGKLSNPSSCAYVDEQYQSRRVCVFDLGGIVCKVRKESFEILVHFTIYMGVGRTFSCYFHMCDKETWTNAKTQNGMSQNITRMNFQDLIYNLCIYISCVAYPVEILYSKWYYLFFKNSYFWLKCYIIWCCFWWLTFHSFF